MVKSEIIKKSPVRVFEETLEGGLGVGNLGAVTARKGVGKTASLIHVAIDKLMRGQHVLHISFSDEPRHITNWYENVFKEIANTYKLEDALEVYDEIIRNRFILHFKQPHTTFKEICDNISDLEKGLDEKPQMIIIDGYPFESASSKDVKEWKKYAQDQQVAIWFSVTMHRDAPHFNKNGIPAPANYFEDLFSVIIMLNPAQDHIDLELLKTHDKAANKKLRLKLDPRTLLLANHRA